MTTLIKTQCPSCQNYLSVPQAQLNEPNPKIRCKRCQQIFLVNDHLISSDNEPATTDDLSTTNDSSISKTHISETTNHTVHTQSKDDLLSSDILIYDDMPVDDLEEVSLESSSIDEMDAWFSQLDTIDNEEQDIFAKKADPTTTSTIDSHSQSTVSSATDTFVNNKNKYDNDEDSWLEKLLEEQNGATDTYTNLDPKESDTDLSQLLTSMGVPPSHPIRQDHRGHQRYQSQLDTEAINSTQSRLYPAQNRVQNSAATLLWLAGCLVLVMLLFAQYVIFNLDHLIKDPAHAARLQAVCAIAACSLPSADISVFEITNPMHRPSEIQTANAFSDIGATLTNQSTQAQLLPSLKVSVYGNDALIGDFIALPKDYLASTQYRLSAKENKPFMFTIPVADHQISQVTIIPIY